MVRRAECRGRARVTGTGTGTGRRRGAALAVALAGALGAGQAEASPEDVFGFGPRNLAMGATGAADSRGFEATWGNPALLSRSHERELTLGFFGAAFDLEAAGARGRAAADGTVSYEGLRGSIIGATLPVPLGGVLRDRLTLGLGFFTPFGLVVRGRILYPETPQFLVADRTQSVAVQVAAGVHVWRGLRVGGGFAALAALSGSVQVATDASGRIGTVVEDTLVASYAPVLGASYDIGDDYRVGATFRGELVGRFNVVIQVKDLGQIVVPPLNISGVAQYDPMQVALEVARVRGPWRVALGATYKRWSEYPGPAEATVRCPDPGEVPDAPTECAALVPVAPGFHDTVVPRVGAERVVVERRGLEAVARAGYFFEPSPAPKQSASANLFDEARSVLTLGWGLSMRAPLPPIQLDWFGQLHVLHGRTHEKRAGIDPANPGAPGVETSGTIVAGGMTAGVRF